MIIEQQVCSLELARRLKQLGVKQQSLFYWIRNRRDEFLVRSERVVPNGVSTYHYEVIASAFTVAELGEMIKCYGSLPFWNEVEWTKSHKDQQGNYHETYHSGTEANARAKMLIYLIENHLIEVESIS